MVKHLSYLQHKQINKPKKKTKNKNNKTTKNKTNQYKKVDCTGDYRVSKLKIRPDLYKFHS